MSKPIIAVLSGGISGEREVSQRSAAALYEALGQDHSAVLCDVKEPLVPSSLDPERHVIVSALHGIFGEDGGMQDLLEKAGFVFSGSDAASSRLCMDKAMTKERVAAKGVRLAAGVSFSAASPPDPINLISDLGEDLVLKPNSEGSSIGLHFISGLEDLRDKLTGLAPGQWLLEQRVRGRELTVGILQGRALGIVEIIPRSGYFDYNSKYTKGLTEYRWPAVLPEALAAEIRGSAETVFSACGCRDFGRVDFILSANGDPFFLEINTIPGLTETSLLPKSALCEGIEFPSLANELIDPALNRFFEMTS